MDELKQYLNASAIDIVCITETHFHKDILEAEVTLPGFIPFRKDRSFKISNEQSSDISEGGGSIIYVRNDIPCEEVKTFVTAPDSTAVKIKTNVGDVCIACIYRSQSLSVQQNDVLLKCINDICHETNPFETLVVGDFNLPNVSWEHSIRLAAGNVDTTDKILCQQKRFVDLFNDIGLSWSLTTEVTRRRLVNGVFQESLLDQLLANNEGLVTGFKIKSPLGKSDHLCIDVNLGVSKFDDNETIELVKKYAWSKISCDQIYSFSVDNINWQFSKEELSVEEMLYEMNGKFKEIDGIIPTNLYDSANVPLKLSWATSALKRKQKLKVQAWAQFELSPTAENFSHAITRQEIYDNENLRLKLNYEKKIAYHVKDNCKAFYSYLRNKRRLKSGVPILECSDGSRTTNSSEAAEELANAFSSVFTHEPLGPLNESSYESDRGMDEFDLTDITISTGDVASELSGLNVYKSGGPDEVHPKLLKALSVDAQFVNAVCALFQKCIDTGTIPSVWKTATVIGLFKSGSKAQALNYRPVSLTCILCKVLEQIIRKQIVEFLEHKINIHQHGFVNKRSCLTNLLETFDTIISILEAGDAVDVLYFDFQKAFDTVPHYRLIIKLERLGIKGKLLDLIRDFLCDRSMKVYVDGKYSTIKKVLSGVPQGSVLGPLLFVLFINDLPDNIRSSIKLFADDLKLIGNASNAKNIVSDLEQLEKWEKQWLLKFNERKCKVMHIKLNKNPCKEYKLNDKVLNESEQEKDLGIVISDTLLWTDQINKCISKANQMICWIVRNFTLREKCVMLRIYKALIRPHLEYGVQLWNPAPEHGNWSKILALESVQRRFTRLIDGMGHIPYSERLGILQLTTLAERRSRGDLIETYKSFTNINGLEHIFKFSICRGNLLSNLKINKTISKNIQQLHRRFLTERVCKFWNKLPSTVRGSETVDGFKSKLESFKMECIADGLMSNLYYWNISNEILARIETPSYLENRVKQVEYLKARPYLAKKKFFNLRY